jgi:hypothetical protein
MHVKMLQEDCSHYAIVGPFYLDVYYYTIYSPGVGLDRICSQYSIRM